ncbi:MAG: hypothetical protein PHH59_06725 [Methylovulum sp.]|uniref:hypothetical protein n=1 Tax=Methylovulum sp. TaxID=1916980 RepID=UPI002635F901|nr:hypothetical protein [Methylovulum sp.]MDD2723700.1 hypothetical protein [Methylovulum sp.]MDD5123326.1 hypothetical protein [Methylovulum sp.]
MANSPSHRFGQIIGDLLEEIMAPQLEDFCQGRGLYLDKKGVRGKARDGKKVAWLDKYGNSHDLDFVIEKGGTQSVRGRPLAFIEAAWRRYTKHSRNKAQEIQGALLPIAEKYHWDKPFLGVILAGVFTEGSLTQMKTSGFEVALFPYESIVLAFSSVGVDVRFDEKTPDTTFQHTIEKIEQLNISKRNSLKQHLIDANQKLLNQFFAELQATLDRQIEQIILIPLHGQQNHFDTISDAISFVSNYQEDAFRDGSFRKYEIIVRYSNGDKIEAFFQNKKKVIDFINYIAEP